MALEWEYQAGIADGLGDVGDNSNPTTFYIGSDLYLIAGASDGKFYGFLWNGSSWDVNAGIVSGLPDVGYLSSTGAFYIGSNLYLITGNSYSSFNGFLWNGSSWDANTDILVGLADLSNIVVTVFFIGTDLYLIAGYSGGTFYGYLWNGTSWDSNAAIVGGLVDVGNYSTPTTFYIGTDLYLLSGDSTGGDVVGYLWNGSSWDSNAEIIAGLPDITAYTYSKPTAYYIGSELYLIIGQNNGIFSGYHMTGILWGCSGAPNYTCIVDVAGGAYASKAACIDACTAPAVTKKVTKVTPRIETSPIIPYIRSFVRTKYGRKGWDKFNL